ncbi:FecR/PupR family sigma factor regulator [Microbulbifer taiwanensis]|uniref:FecR/PupR family sigma factor regulator n=1 Tax=Microbulbifer taiwanensis TaxID=986746 RepID=A0ABW1YIX8_9GAMM|nr:FecR/PupR family sigma factor regulator [Microbulbifer taiwanensis]
MTDIECGDAAWNQAVDWLMREHEESLDDAAREALIDWLASPAHRKAYEQARTLWLVTGLVPTSDEQSDPPSDDD